MGVALDKPVVAAQNAQFSYPEAKAGVAGGVAASLAARIPTRIAGEMLLLGDAIDARRAYEVGLVNKVVPLGQERDAALDYARTLASNAPRRVRMMKGFIAETIAHSPPEIGAIARREIADVVFSEDYKEFFKSLEEFPLAEALKICVQNGGASLFMPTRTIPFAL